MKPAGGKAGEPGVAGLVDISLVAAEVLSLLVACVVWSGRKQEWVDEIYTRTEAGDPSWHHLWHAAQHLGSAGMPMFYLTAWPWAHVIGNGDLSLRLYSCVGFCAAFILFWRMLRRFYGLHAVALGMLTIYSSGILLNQNAEARHYGLFMLATALASAAWLPVAVARKARPGWAMLAWLLLSQAALVLTHLLGVIYGGLMLVAMLLLDTIWRRFRPMVYLSMAAGWLALAFWWVPIQWDVAEGKPWPWMPVADAGVLWLAYGFELLSPILFTLRRIPHYLPYYAWPLTVVAVGLAVAAVVQHFQTGRAAGWNRKDGLEPDEPLNRERADGRTALVVLGLCLFAAPLFIFIVSMVKPVFTFRYFVPALLGMAILLTSFADRFFTTPGTARRLAWRVAVAVLLVCPVLAARLVRPEHVDTALIDTLAGSRLPLVMGSQHDFFVMQRYSAHQERNVYLLDWPSALIGTRRMTTDFHAMVDYRDEGYFSRNIRESAEFLRDTPRFLVLDSSEENWFEVAIQKNPAYAWQVIQPIDKDRRLIEVERVQ